MQLNNKIKLLSSKEHNWHGLTLTDSAARQIRHIVVNDPSILGVRLSVKQSGCAGLSYVLEKAILLSDSDLVYEHNRAKLYVPLKVMPFIDGTKLDYVQEGLNHVFKFYNPIAQHSCGCGESFSL